MSTVPDLAERDSRFRRVREAMARECLDALLVAGKGNWWNGRGYFRYFTDFHLWGHEGLILIPLDGEPTLVLTASVVAELIAERGWITDVHGDQDLSPRMIALMKARGLDKGRVGIAGFKWVLGAGDYLALVESLPGVTFLNADRLLDRVRMIKSPLEIRQNYEHRALTRAALERFVEAVEPGKSQRELWAEACKTAIAGGARDMRSKIGKYWPLDEPMPVEGIQSFHIEICGERGYWSEMTVVMAFRDPTELEQRRLQTELRAFQEIQQMARPGVMLSDLARTFERVLIEDGWQLTEEKMQHWDFHGQGLDVMEYPHWGPLRPDEDTLLEEGMIFSYHPRREMLPKTQNSGICEDIVITAGGAARLCPDWDPHWRLMR